MINASKLQYFTMAAWMRGYAAKLSDDDYEDKKLAQKLEKAADMLDAVFSKYTEEFGEDHEAN